MSGWISFLVALVVAVSVLMISNRRETVNQTRYSVACDTKSDSARAFIKGLAEGSAR